MEIEKPVKAAVDQILNDFNNSPEKFGEPRRETARERAKQLILTPKFCIPIAFIVLVIILLSCGLPLLLMNKQNAKVMTTLASSTTTTIGHYPTAPPTFYPQSSTAVSEATTNTPATSEEPFSGLKIIKREAWISQGLEVTGKYSQLLPIKRIIILNTRTDSCYDDSSCIVFIEEHQQSSYPEFDDVKENFFIGINGAVYEGRGFAHEGQASSDSLTSYNSNAVSISFILQGDDEKPNERQQDALRLFIKLSIDDKKIEENYLVYRQSDLEASFFEHQDNDEEIVTGSCNVSLHKRKALCDCYQFFTYSFLLKPRK